MTVLKSSYPERIIPSETEPGVVSLHLKRYDFSLPHCQDKVVLDLACGVGYGSAYLAKVAKQVVGGEIDPEALRYAELHYSQEKVTFKKMDATKLLFPDSSFDTVCSFETIEHLHNIEAYLKEVTRVLKPSGIYLVSTPQVRRTTRKPANPFHTVEFSRKDFEALLTKYFSQLEVFGQRRVQSNFHYYLQKLDVFNLRSKLIPTFLVKKMARSLNTTPIQDLDLSDLLITKEKIERAAELVVVCRGPRKTV